MQGTTFKNATIILEDGQEISGEVIEFIKKDLTISVDGQVQIFNTRDKNVKSVLLS